MEQWSDNSKRAKYTAISISYISLVEFLCSRFLARYNLIYFWMGGRKVFKLGCIGVQL